MWIIINALRCQQINTQTHSSTHTHRHFLGKSNLYTLRRCMLVTSWHAYSLITVQVRELTFLPLHFTQWYSHSSYEVHIATSLKPSSRSFLNFLISTLDGNNSFKGFATPLRFVLDLMGRYMVFTGNGSFSSSYLLESDIFTVNVAPSASLTLRKIYENFKVWIICRPHPLAI